MESPKLIFTLTHPHPRSDPRFMKVHFQTPGPPSCWETSSSYIPVSRQTKLRKFTWFDKQVAAKRGKNVEALACSPVHSGLVSIQQEKYNPDQNRRSTFVVVNERVHTGKNLIHFPNPEQDSSLKTPVSRQTLMRITNRSCQSEHLNIIFSLRSDGADILQHLLSCLLLENGHEHQACSGTKQ